MAEQIQVPLELSHEVLGMDTVVGKRRWRPCASRPCAAGCIDALSAGDRARLGRHLRASGPAASVGVSAAGGGVRARLDRRRRPHASQPVFTRVSVTTGICGAHLDGGGARVLAGSGAHLDSGSVHLHGVQRLDGGGSHLDGGGARVLAGSSVQLASWQRRRASWPAASTRLGWRHPSGPACPHLLVKLNCFLFIAN